jgi:hypothetical protein
MTDIVERAAELLDQDQVTSAFEMLTDEVERLRALLSEGLQQVDEYPEDLISSDWLVRVKAALRTDSP